MSLILHCGAQEVTLADLRAVEIPRTRSHRPIPYADSVEFLLDGMRQTFDLEPKSMRFGLQREGAQMFAQIDYDIGDAKRTLSVGLRNSYDMSLRCKFGGGASMLVCDNLCFHADGFVVMRKNTTYAWRDFQGMVRKHLPTLMDQFKATVSECNKLEAVPCGLDCGYAMLGVALGRKLMTPTQANVAFKDWREPRHEEFTDRNLWSLYNCATEGLKKGALGNAIERHVDVHSFMLEQASKPVNGNGKAIIEAKAEVVQTVN